MLEQQGTPVIGRRASQKIVWNGFQISTFLSYEYELSTQLKRNPRMRASSTRKIERKETQKQKNIEPTEKSEI